MPHDVAFHQGLYYLLRKNRSSEKEKRFFEIITCEPLIYTMDHPDLIVCSCMEKSIGLRKVNYIFYLLLPFAPSDSVSVKSFHFSLKQVP